MLSRVQVNSGQVGLERKEAKRGPGGLWTAMDPNHAEVERQERGRARGRGRGRGQQRQVISDEIHATVVHHVVVHGRTMKEAGQLVQPNLSRFTVASIVRTFRRENRTERQPSIGGRRRLLTAEQETALVNMVMANNAITLREIQTHIIEDQEIFQGTNSISLSTIDRVIQQNHIRTKQLYRVPFERNRGIGLRSNDSNMCR
ncbi:hypothetical protein N1851_028189 [Merluccius polli]|uniref:Uncharacterized protein n=1 Tax=Merluccius polli TaxID=89951 RepID=A0AA47M960_MERPO|nr:hypothetical protein N1851_028189 [Merluccius polli]